ncbi:hypothetical protein OG906_41765 (plasmid) [Streptomyces sp. NBC_01426]|nr:hypothetical protein [Streptomyces sp. NBC_01426]
MPSPWRPRRRAWCPNYQCLRALTFALVLVTIAYAGSTPRLR